MNLNFLIHIYKLHNKLQDHQRKFHGNFLKTTTLRPNCLRKFQGNFLKSTSCSIEKKTFFILAAKTGKLSRLVLEKPELAGM